MEVYRPMQTKDFFDVNDELLNLHMELQSNYWGRGSWDWCVGIFSFVFFLYTLRFRYYLCLVANTGIKRARRKQSFKWNASGALTAPPLGMKHSILVALVLQLDGADALQRQPKPTFQNSPKDFRYEVR